MGVETTRETKIREVNTRKERELERYVPYKRIQIKLIWKEEVYSKTYVKNLLQQYKILLPQELGALDENDKNGNV